MARDEGKSSWRKVLEEVSRERIRGSSWCARRVAEAFILLGETEFNEEVLSEAVELALRVNPSMASIYNVASIARNARSSSQLVSSMKKLLEYMDYSRSKACSIASESIMGDIMTISYSSMIECVLSKAKDNVGKVYVLESRPGGEGLYMAKKLREHGLDVVVVFDSALYHYMSRVDIVIVGADSVGKDACIVNKIGTRLLAMSAKEYNIEFYPIFESYKIHPEKSCYEIELVEREYEVEDYGRVRTVVFDRTPAKLISGFITEHGYIPPTRLGVKQAYEKFIESVTR